MKRIGIRRALEAAFVSLGVWVIVICSAIPARAQIIQSITPISTVAGGPMFSLAVTGSGFNTSSQVRWNGMGRTTTFNSATSLSATITAADIATPGTAMVQVFNGAMGSNPVTFTIINPSPVISGINPNSAVAGGPAFTLTVGGSGFVSGSVVRWNGQNRMTTFGSATSLTAMIPASDIAAAGPRTVTVLNPAPGGGTSNEVTFTVTAPNPMPSVSSLSPNSATAGGGDFTLTVNGNNFIQGSVVRWNGANRETTFGSGSRLTAAIPASDIAAAGIAAVTVLNPAPGGGASNAVNFTINNPDPEISAIDPTSAIAGGPAFTLSVSGTGFVQGSVVRWNGANRMTTFGSGTSLSASIPASDIASAGTAAVTVFNGGPGGGSSSSRSFTIVAPNPVPSIGSLEPSSIAAGSAAFTLTVNGTGFVSSSVVQWNGAARATSFGSNTRLTASIPASDVAVGGSASVTVFSPGPGGGTSSEATFTINNPVPVLGSINPTSATAGGPAFTLTVNGSNFVSGAVVRWNGSDRPTTGSGSQLTATIPATDIAAGGTASVTVANPSPGGGASNAATFTINNPVPVISSINPTSATTGGPAFTLTVAGSNFVSGSVVRWNGADRPTTGSGSQLTATIPASDIATGGTASIVVVNPGPGGGTSNAVSFTISNILPTISSINPTTATAGGPAFTLAIAGTNFVTGSVVRWNGADRPTTFGSSTQLTAAIPASDIAAPGTANITVSNPAPGGGVSTPATFAITNPTPSITGIAPSSAVAGGGAFTLVVNGTNFVSGSIVRWNGSDRPTVFVSSNQISASILAADLATGGTSSVTVFNPAPGGGSSSAVSFQVNNPVPAISGLSPSSAAAGSGAFTLTISGTGFISASVVRWNGAERPTTSVSSTLLTVTIPASDIATTGSAIVTVSNPAPVGGTSNAVTFPITTGNPVPAITTLSPNQAGAGGPAFTLTVNGTGFVSGSVVRWNGADRTTSFVSDTQLNAAIPASDIATIGTASVTVISPSPGGGTSNAVMISIVSGSPTPAITRLEPASTAAGGPAFTLTVIGTGFVSASAVRWNGLDRPTTFTSGTELRASIPASDIATAGVATITVFSPPPGGGTSNAQSFTILGAGVSINGLSDTLESLQQPSINLTVAAPRPVAVSGRMILVFAGPTDDPAVQFEGGGRTVNFTIPANSTQAVFAGNATSTSFQTGTTAGTITLEAVPEGMVGSTRTSTVSRRAPRITSLTIGSRTSSSFQLVMVGYSNIRNLTQGVFRFAGRAGTNLQTSSLTVDLSSAFATWYQSAASAPFGTQFRLVVPFNVQGDINAIGSVSVTLTNAEGTSEQVTVNF
jgi:hypothetical protein